MTARAAQSPPCRRAERRASMRLSSVAKTSRTALRPSGARPPTRCEVVSPTGCNSQSTAPSTATSSMAKPSPNPPVSAPLEGSEPSGQIRTIWLSRQNFVRGTRKISSARSSSVTAVPFSRIQDMPASSFHCFFVMLLSDSEE